jgi:hypothetical protein
MPRWFVAISAWFAASAYRMVPLAVAVLGGLVAFSAFRDRVGFFGALAVLILWWLVLVVVWFDARKEANKSGFRAWARALFLDFFLLMLVAIARRVSLG